MGTAKTMNPLREHELPRMEEEHEVRLAYNPQVGGWEAMTPTAPRVEYPLGRLAGREAKKYSKHFDKHTRLARRRRRNVTSLRWSDLEIRQLLGAGNFSHVYEVKLIRKEPIVDDSVTIITSSRTISTNVWEVQSKWNDPCYDRDMWDLVSVVEGGRSEDGDYENHEKPYEEDEPDCYALKHLHPSVARNEEDFTSSVIDLVLEAKLLANLKHENIVKLHAVTEGSISRVFCTGGYFLLLDRLYGTLEEKIEEWRLVDRAAVEASSRQSLRRRRFPFMSATNSRPSSSTRPPSQANVTPPHIQERLRSVAVGIARGLEYLHANRIIFRDLKPSNVGFAYNGTVKIFDFGLAREILDGEHRMTANTGSLRYMSPDVNLGQNYGLSADIYSYGIMLWEITTLITPFDGMTTDDHSKYVIHGGARPKIDKVPGSQNLKLLIQACWHADAKKRPTSTGVRNTLLAELANTRRHTSVSKNDKPKRSSIKKFRMRLVPQPGRRRTARYREVDEQTVLANTNKM